MLLIKLAVVLDTTKVQIFKQITTESETSLLNKRLFQIPQRYRFSSKSQRNFIKLSDLSVVLDTTKVQIFKQITTVHAFLAPPLGCFRYHKGTDFQANHNVIQILAQKSKGCFRYHKGTDFQANHNAFAQRRRQP